MFGSVSQLKDCVQATSLDEEGMVDESVYAPAMIPGAAANPAYASPSPPPPPAATSGWDIICWRSRSADKCG